MNKIDLLSKLISINSVSGKETEIAKFVFDWLTNKSLNPVIQDNNVIVCIKGKNSSKAIVFNSHVDTVSPGDVNHWTHDPFNPLLVENKLYGLGASDTKGGVATLLLLAEFFSKNKPPMDVWFSFPVREELDGLGTKMFTDWFVKNTNYKKVAAVICEPTSLATMEIGHKGNAFLKVVIKGQTGHGSRPWLIKHHAILEAYKVVKDIEIQNKIWKEKFTDPLIGFPTVALTGISTGSLDSPNKFPEICTLQLDIRTTPALHSKLDLEVKNWLSKYEVKYEYIVDPAPFGWCDRNEKIVEIIKELIPDVKIICSEGATDQCFFSQKGIPAVILGPGEKKQSHQLNEYCYPKQILQAVEIFKKIIKKWA